MTTKIYQRWQKLVLNIFEVCVWMSAQEASEFGQLKKLSRHYDRNETIEQNRFLVTIK